MIFWHLQLEAIKKEIERDASKAYWKWVASAKILHIYEELYQLSLKHQKQFEEKFKKGDMAQITVIENEKNILRHKSALAKAKQDFENSATYLSLFWRSENGAPLVPKQSEVPKINFMLNEINIEQNIRNIQNALEHRPELRIIKIKIEQNSSELKYANDLYRPQLDAEFNSSKDLGNGLNSRSQGNNNVGINFLVPPQQREARGQSSKYQAELIRTTAFARKNYQRTRTIKSSNQQHH